MKEWLSDFLKRWPLDLRGRDQVLRSVPTEDPRTRMGSSWGRLLRESPDDRVRDSLVRCSRIRLFWIGDICLTDLKTAHACCERGDIPGLRTSCSNSAIDYWADAWRAFAVAACDADTGEPRAAFICEFSPDTDCFTYTRLEAVWSLPIEAVAGLPEPIVVPLR